MQDSVFHFSPVEFNKPYSTAGKHDKPSNKSDINENYKLLSNPIKARCNGFHSEPAAALNIIHCRNALSLNFTKFKF